MIRPPMFVALLLAGFGPGARAQMTPSSPSRLGPSPGVINVISCGADPSFVQDSTAAIQACADQAFGPAGARHGLNAENNVPLYFPPGHYKISAPILLQYVQGAMIFGAGRFTSTVENVVGTGVFRTDGFEYSEVRDLNLQDDGKTSPVFDLDWPSNSTIACQSNTFSNLNIGGGAVGVRIGHAGFMCSENMFLNDFVSGATDGYELDNYNALQNTLLGGDIAQCQIGVLVNEGSMSVHSTGFQLNSQWDYQQINAANDAVVIDGSRTESANFASLASGGETVAVSGVSQTSSKPGIFIQVNGGRALISGSDSLNGQVVINHGGAQVAASRFGRSDWLWPHYADRGDPVVVTSVQYGYSRTPRIIASQTIP